MTGAVRAALILLALSGCAIPADGPATATIAGRVAAGPTCPVVHAGEEELCRDRPLAAAIRIADLATGRVAAAVQSAADGTFSAPVPAGTYRVSADSGATLPACGSAEVTATAGETAVVELSCDTGIR